MEIQPYLNFNGQCEEAFRFYAGVLGGKLGDVHRYGGSPITDMVPADWADKVMHTSLQIGRQTLLGCDTAPDRSGPMRGFAVNIGLDNVADAERIFNALSEGGKVHMPFGETFWAERFAMFMDRFGTPWMINVPRPM